MNISVFVLSMALICVIGVHADVQPQRDFNLQRVRHTDNTHTHTHTHTLGKYIYVLLCMYVCIWMIEIDRQLTPVMDK